MVNREFIESIYDILRTFQEVAVEMQKAYANENYDLYFNLSTDLIENATEVRGYALNNMPRDDKSRLADACTCIIESAKNIAKLADEGSKEVTWKLDNELECIIESTLFQVEYFYWVEPGLESEEQFKENFSVSRLMRPKRDIENGKECACDLLISITGYNKLDYTKKCVESVLANIPSGICTELILINHGSSDGTQRYFESVENAHVLNYAVNGAIRYMGIGCNNSKYILSISNDVVVGKNSIENIYRAISENPEYGYTVPSTSNVSNYQIMEEAIYDTDEEFEEFTRKNNVYDVRRHEQRVRLCDPISGYSTLKMYNMLVDFCIENFFKGSIFSFPDDKRCLWMRRKGYKNMLLKDAYCHHYGSVTLKEDKETDNNSNTFFMLGREAFYKTFGVDPWGTGSIFDMSLIKALEIESENDAIILGINCGLGANPLKIRETMREKGANNVKIINATQSEVYLSDLKGISDEAFLFKDMQDIIEKSGRKSFKYILVDDAVEGIPSIEQLVDTFVELGFESERIMINRADGNWLILKSNGKEA
ncbi:MAG: glycosyltransferase [Lachnospiraceae bacterium]|nr:glycosyltransferase [Lachnospiraceae bacterium]